MRLDYKNEPFFESIENGTLDLKMMDSLDEVGYKHVMNWLDKIWGHAAPHIRKNICYPSATYLQAVYKSMPSFTKLLKQSMFEGNEIESEGWTEDTMTPEPLTEQEMKADEIYKSMLGESYGCYLLAKGTLLFIYGMHTDCAYEDAYSFVMYVYKGRLVACFVQKGEDYSYCCSNHPIALDIFSTAYGKTALDAREIVAQMAHEKDMFILFEKYAKIENRIVMPKTRFRYDFKSMAMDENATRLKIQIRDSSYFTNIIRKGDFGVRGHLRLQPKKINGEWTHELIYIDSFVKHGYHRQAKLTKVS